MKYKNPIQRSNPHKMYVKEKIYLMLSYKNGKKSVKT